ncbi:MAG: hypothetical protein DMG50_26085 [Acidobacteria bacterium]|nr:MAG: hypothetical protein DMG50_26085 [Acidobacteriota bacterium]
MTSDPSRLVTQQGATILLWEGGMLIWSLWAPPMLLPGNASNPAPKLAIWRIPFCYNRHQGMRICESQSGTGSKLCVTTQIEEMDESLTELWRALAVQS